MAQDSNTKHWTFRRIWDGLFDRLGVRPLGVIVFTLSAFALILITQTSAGKVSAPAIAGAPLIEHPANSATYVESAYVHPGDLVQTGAPLVTLSAHFLERELILIDAEITRVEREAELEQARERRQNAETTEELRGTIEQARRQVREAEAEEDYRDDLAQVAGEYVEQTRDQVERQLTQADELIQARLDQQQTDARARYNDRLVRVQRDYFESISQPLQDAAQETDVIDSWVHYYEAELQTLRAQRQALLDDLQDLTIYAQTDGRVVTVLAQGSSVAIETSVASIVPVHPTEIVAYLDPAQSPELVPAGSEVRLVSETTNCPDPGRVIRLGAMVEEAPGQLNDFLNNPIWGLPVHISIPENCPLGVGQTLSVEFALVQR